MKSLSARRYFIFVVLLFFLGGCAWQPVNNGNDSLDVLYREGTLAKTVDLQEDGDRYRTALVTLGDLVYPWQAPVGLVFPDTFPVAFEITDRVWHEARLRRLAFRINDEIQAGQFVAELYYEDNTLLEIHLMELTFERQEFERWFAEEDSRRLNELANLQHELQIAENWQQTALLLSRRELEYTLFLQDNQQRSEHFNQREQDLNRQLKGERLYAPVDGIVTFVTTAANGVLFRDIPYVWASSNPPGFGIMTVVDDSSLYFTVSGRRDVFRYGQVFLVRGVLASGPSFYVKVANDPLIFPVSRSGTQEIMLIPADETAFLDELALHGLRPWDLRGIDFVIEAPVVLAVDTVLVPTEAIHTENVRSFVYVYDDNLVRRRYVNVGVGFGGLTQILTGLTPGQRVILP
jgi:hypothetical protein